LAFTASLTTFSVAGWPSGLSAHDPSALFVKTAESVLPRLRGTFRAPLVHLDRSSPVRLSWDSFSRVCPTSDMPRLRPLPEDVAISVRPVAAKRPTCSVLVVSHHRNGFLRTRGLGSIAPRSRMRFAAFLEDRPARQPVAEATICTDGDMSPFPASAVHTLRRIPLACSRTASLQPLPSCRCDDFKALLRRRVRSVHGRCRSHPPYTSMGFVPLQGPFPPGIRHRERRWIIPPAIWRVRWRTNEPVVAGVCPEGPFCGRLCPPDRHPRVNCTSGGDRRPSWGL
jgi:hypothetical protein